jgi:hypothetical protein
MKCNIIIDLLPLYCDKLTSQDSNEEIEKHLHECKECNAIYESMNQKEDDIKVPDKDVKPLKKIKKRTKLKVIGAVFGTLAVLAAAFVFLFVGVIPIKSDKLHYTVTAIEVKSYTVKSDVPDEKGDYSTEYRTEFSDDFYPIPEGVEVKAEKRINIEYEGDCSCTNERIDATYEDYLMPDGKHHGLIIHSGITIYPVIRLPFDDRGEHPNQHSSGYIANEGNTLTIHCRDKDIKLDLYQLWLDNIEK